MNAQEKRDLHIAIGREVRQRLAKRRVSMKDFSHKYSSRIGLRPITVEDYLGRVFKGDVKFNPIVRSGSTSYESYSVVLAAAGIGPDHDYVIALKEAYPNFRYFGLSVHDGDSAVADLEKKIGELSPKDLIVVEELVDKILDSYKS